MYTVHHIGVSLLNTNERINVELILGVGVGEGEGEGEGVD